MYMRFLCSRLFHRRCSVLSVISNRRYIGWNTYIHYFSVLYGGDTTSAALVEYAVRQGSVLGPLLFVLYTSDVPRVINECGLLSVVYADDTQIYVQVKQRDIPVAKVRVEDCMAKVKQWLTSNRLRLNPSKTEAMWCTSSRRRSSFEQPSLVVDQNDAVTQRSRSGRPTSCRSISRRSRIRSHTQRLLQHPSTSSTTIIDDTRSSSPCSVRTGPIKS